MDSIPTLPYRLSCLSKSRSLTPKPELSFPELFCLTCVLAWESSCKDVHSSSPNREICRRDVIIAYSLESFS
jgi:hypothetical protein